MPPVNPTPNQLSARLNPTPTNITLPTGGLYRAAGDNGDAVYGFDANGTPTRFGIVPPGAAKNNDYGANLAYLKSTYGVDFNSLPTFNKADVDQHLIQSGKVGSNGMPVYGSGDIASFIGTPASAITKTINNTPNALGTPQPDTTPKVTGTFAPGSPQNSGSLMASAQPNATPTLNSNLPGASATTLYDYFSSRGQALPSVPDRANTFEQLGLGKAADYQGTSQQNTELLAALQRKDYSATTFGDPSQQSTANAGSLDLTSAGQDINSTLGTLLGSDTASGTLDNYQTFLATALGKTWDSLTSDEGAVNTFISNMKPADQILQDAMDAAGVSEGNTLLKKLDAEISSQQDILGSLPSDIKTSLQDVGVSQAQLDRLVAKESKGPTDALNKLLTERNATSSEIDKAMSFAKSFADTQASTQAARLAALEWQVTSERGDYSNLSSDVKSVLTNAINDQKDILSTAKTAAENGAPQATVQKILDSGSSSSALLAAGSYMVKPATPSGTKTSMSSDLGDIGGILEVGGQGFNGRGVDGKVDPYAYAFAYSYMQQTYGPSGVNSFLSKYPPSKELNSTAIGQGILPPELETLVQAGTKQSGGIQ